MQKILTLAAIAAIGLSGFATLPAAAANGSVPYCSSDEHQIGDNADHIVGVLRQQGYDISGIDTWNGCIRAFVTDTSGHQAMAFFDPALKLIDGNVTPGAPLGGAVTLSPDIQSDGLRG